MNRKRRNPCHRPFPAVSALAVLLLATLAAPVWAADQFCLDFYGNPDPDLNTDQGSENGVNNSSCSSTTNAYGQNNFAQDFRSSAFGSFNSATGGGNAFGSSNTASGSNSNAFGASNYASGPNSNAFGSYNYASGQYSSAFGAGGSAMGAGSLSMAGWYDRNGDGVITWDLNLDGDGIVESSSETASAGGVSAVAVGTGVIATGSRSSAMGVDNTASGPDSSAVGRANTASGVNSSAFGSTNTALGDGDAAIGYNNTTGVDDYFSLSANNAALGVGNTAIGGFAAFLGDPSTSSVAVGAGNQATADNSSALGVENLASGVNSTAIGYSSVASADDSTAIGSNSVADRENTLSVGAVGAERQIVNVDDATQDTDAVNLSQLYPMTTALGGGASYAGGVFTAPTYVIQSGNYNDVGSAFAAVDGAIDDINERIVAVGGIQGEQGESAYEVAVSNGFAGTESDWLDSLQGDAGPAGPTGPEGPAGGGPRSVTYDSDERDVLTLAGAEGTRIANVADGVEATDAVNLQQMQAGDAATLSSAQDYADAGDATTLASANTYTDNTATETLTSANAYTDQRFAELIGLSTDFEAFRGEVDDRFRQQDRRIDRMSSISGAYAGMAMNTSGLAGRNRVGVGVGSQGGERALAVGYQRAIGNRASVSIAGAFSGDEKSVSAGAGFSW